MCPCSGSPFAGLIFSVLLMFFCLVWWISYKFDQLMAEIKPKKK